MTKLDPKKRIKSCQIEGLMHMTRADPEPCIKWALESNVSLPSTGMYKGTNALASSSDLVLFISKFFAMSISTAEL